VKHSLPALLLAVALTGCSGDNDKSASTQAVRSCPTLNGVYSQGSDSVTIETRVEGDKFSYNFGDGVIFFEADAAPFGVDNANSFQVTCGSNSITLHILRNGQETDTTFVDVGGNQISVETNGYTKVLPKTADLPQREDPDHPSHPPTGEAFCPVINGTYRSDDGKIELAIATNQKFGKDEVYAFRVGGLDDQFRTYTAGKYVDVEGSDGPPRVYPYTYAVDCNAGNWLMLSISSQRGDSLWFTASVRSDGSLDAEIRRNSEPYVKANLRLKSAP
jgi:hypothetical protein